LIYSERGEPGTGGQKGDQGKKYLKKHIVWIDLFNYFFSGAPGAPGIDGKFFTPTFYPINHCFFFLL
jgi:hypothetical protein